MVVHSTLDGSEAAHRILGEASVGPLDLAPSVGFRFETRDGTSRRLLEITPGPVGAAPRTHEIRLGNTSDTMQYRFDSAAGGNTSIGGDFIACPSLQITQPGQTGGSPNAILLTGGTMAALAASTEAVDVDLNLARTVQFATGAKTFQRAVGIRAPTYSAVGATTTTQAVSLHVDSAPFAGTNMTITRRYTGLFGIGRFRVADTSGGQDTVDLFTDDTTGRRCVIEKRETTVTMNSGTATVDVTDWIPAHCLVLFAQAEVTTAITGCTTWNIGIAGDTTRFGNGNLLTVGIQNYGEDASGGFARYYPARTSIRFTAIGGGAVFTTGAIRLSLTYIRARFAWNDDF